MEDIEAFSFYLLNISYTTDLVMMTIGSWTTLVGAYQQRKGYQNL